MIDREICRFLVRDVEAHRRRALIAERNNAHRASWRELARAREVEQYIVDACPGFSARTFSRSWRPS